MQTNDVSALGSSQQTPEEITQTPEEIIASLVDDPQALARYTRSLATQLTKSNFLLGVQAKASKQALEEYRLSAAIGNVATEARRAFCKQNIIPLDQYFADVLARLHKLGVSAYFVLDGSREPLFGTIDDLSDFDASRFNDSHPLVRRMRNVESSDSCAWNNTRIDGLWGVQNIYLRVNKQHRRLHGRLYITELPARVTPTDVKNQFAIVAHEIEHILPLDTHTGCLDKHTLQTNHDHIMAACHSHRENVFVAILDLDNFKRVNDVLGHQAGDAYLREIGSLFASQFSRADDFIERSGGDEFTLVFTGKSQEDAELFLDDFLVLLRSHTTFSNCPSLAQIRESGLMPGLSIGLTCMLDPQSLSASLATADEHMYAAKSLGGWLVCSDSNVKHNQITRLRSHVMTLTFPEHINPEKRFKDLDVVDCMQCYLYEDDWSNETFEQRVSELATLIASRIALSR